MRRFIRRLVLAALLTALACAAAEETEISMEALQTGGDAEIAVVADETPLPMADTATAETPSDAEETAPVYARDELIDAIIENGRRLYEQANGKLQRAHYAGDHYVCKNFTTYVFELSREPYRLAEYPDVMLFVPANKTAEECKPNKYGYCWKDVTAQEGNPFEAAAQFLYDPALSKAENLENAKAFMRQVQKGDYFQMSADYYYGVGAHSAIMIADYDAENDSVHWMDSNMAGQNKGGIRYGKVQFDAVKDVTWWAEAFCHKGRGATLYRLREDIIRVE